MQQLIALLGIYENKIQVNYTHSQLKEAQEKYGGYTGKDIATISRKINRQPKTVRRQIEKKR